MKDEAFNPLDKERLFTAPPDDDKVSEPSAAPPEPAPVAVPAPALDPAREAYFRAHHAC
jgi:hypothetical protein